MALWGSLLAPLGSDFGTFWDLCCAKSLSCIFLVLLFLFPRVALAFCSYTMLVRLVFLMLGCSRVRLFCNRASSAFSCLASVLFGSGLAHTGAEKRQLVGQRSVHLDSPRSGLIARGEESEERGGTM